MVKSHKDVDPSTKSHCQMSVFQHNEKRMFIYRYLEIGNKFIMLKIFLQIPAVYYLKIF